MAVSPTSCGGPRNRFAKSVCGLLVEGAGRQIGRDSEFRRYCVMALGSVEESKLWLRYAVDLGFIEAGPGQQLTERFVEIARMLQGLIKRLSSDASSLSFSDD